MTAGTLNSEKITGAFVPGAAGPWMVAAVAGVVRLDQLRSTVICVSALFKSTVPKPVPCEAVGGTSWAPVRDASNNIVARAGTDKSVTAANNPKA